MQEFGSYRKNAVYTTSVSIRLSEAHESQAKMGFPFLLRLFFCFSLTFFLFWLVLFYFEFCETQEEIPKM